MNDFHADAITLTGRDVRLEPLTLAHVDPLCEVGLDPELWRYTTVVLRTRDEMRSYIAEAMVEQARDVAVPFATVDLKANRVVGCTRFGAIVPEHRRVEIGWTFIARPWQRTAVNSEAKLLMLRHAFETWGLRRVEFKTHRLNRQSREALVRLGAVEEGTLRSHILQPDGTWRDTVYYSILDSEWPLVRERLEARLEAGGT